MISIRIVRQPFRLEGTVMKKRACLSFKILLFISIGLAGLVTGCIPGSVSWTPTSSIPLPTTAPSNTPSATTVVPATSTATTTSTSVPSHTTTITPIPSPTPTLEPTLTDQSSEVYVLELLETNGGCKLPCFWGIIPGQIALEDAKRFTYHLGWWGGDYYNGTVYEAAHDLTQRLVIHIALQKSAGMVGTLHSSIAGDDYLNLVKAYTFRQILLDYGKPTQVWINLATALEINTPEVTAFCTLLYYQESAILVKYCGSAVKIGSAYRLCPTTPNYGNPNESPTGGSVSLTLGIPGKVNTPNELMRPFGPFDGMLTVDEALKMSVDEFYDQAMSNPSVVCYETQRDVWP
jgi:hypothetical protein